MQTQTSAVRARSNGGLLPPVHVFCCREFEEQLPTHKLKTFTDTDYTGCWEARKSTNGRFVFIQDASDKVMVNY